MNSETLPFENLRPLPVRGRVIRTPWLRHLATFLLVFGPGLIVMEADNDAGAVSTYVQAGAQYGTRFALDHVSVVADHIFHPGDGCPIGDSHRQRPRGSDL